MKGFDFDAVTLAYEVDVVPKEQQKRIGCVEQVISPKQRMYSARHQELQPHFVRALDKRSHVPHTADAMQSTDP